MKALDLRNLGRFISKTFLKEALGGSTQTEEATFNRPKFKKESYRRTYSRKEEWLEDQDQDTGTSNSGKVPFPD